MKVAAVVVGVQGVLIQMTGLDQMMVLIVVVVMEVMEVVGIHM